MLSMALTAVVEVVTATLVAKSRTSVAVVWLFDWRVIEFVGLMHWPKGDDGSDMM